MSRTQWDKYGGQQARRGAEYVSACVLHITNDLYVHLWLTPSLYSCRYRSVPRLAGNDVFEPGEFAGMTTSLDMVHSYAEEEKDGQLSLSKAEIREVRLSSRIYILRRLIWIVNHSFIHY